MAPLLLLAALGCVADIESSTQNEGRAHSISGSATWSVEFDDGTEPCTYTRTYEGLEDRSHDWLCPSCEILFRADVSFEGQDCYDLVSEGYPHADVEWLGWGADVFYRSGTENYVLTEQGAVGDSLEWTSSTDWLDLVTGTKVRFDIDGAFVKTPNADGDAYHGFGPPDFYACGWPKADPPPYEGDFAMGPGLKLPDGLFLDRCEQPVRLHDFAGRYLVITVSSMDCGPCQDMAQGEWGFVAGLAAEGIEVEAITLLAPTLDAVLDPTTTSQLDSWVDAYGLHGPVLADRGWGVWVAGEALGDGFGYPTWIVVDPGLAIIELDSGFRTWDRMATIIRNDAD